MRTRTAVCCVALVVCLALLSVAAVSDLQISYYDLLEVPSDVEAAQLKKAYRVAALKWHPDRYADRADEQAEANARFVLIAEGQTKDFLHRWWLEVRKLRCDFSCC